jgi:hypothetical protein
MATSKAVRRRTLLGLQICCFLGIALTGSIAHAIAAPQYIDIYWESSTHTWANDIQAASTQASGTNPDNVSTERMTEDFYDSVVRSLLASSFFNGLAAYGTTPVAVPIASLEVSNCGDPPAMVGAAGPAGMCGKNDAGVSKCGGVDDGKALNSFLSCLLAAHPNLNNANVVLNIFLPPWVGGKNPGQDACAVTGDCGWNFSVNGTELTINPTNTHCNSSINNWGTACLTHEMQEAVAGQFADECEGISYSFLNYGMQPFEKFGANCPIGYGTCHLSNDCTPDQNAVPAMKWANVAVCASDFATIVQGDLDARNSQPWDMPTPANKYLSSMYVGIQVDATARGGKKWQTEMLHFTPAGAGTPAYFATEAWNQAGAADAFVQLTGFSTNSGYKSGDLKPGDLVTLLAYDPVWGQLSPVTAVAASGFGPNALLSLELPQSWDTFYNEHLVAGDSATITGILQYGPCGLSGHQVTTPIPNATVTIASNDSTDAFAPLSVTTNNVGAFSFTYTPKQAGSKNISVSTSSNVAGAITVQVFPAISNINQDQGSVSGGQTVTITGQGFPFVAMPGQTFNVDFGTAPNHATKPAITKSTSMTASTPISNLPAPGTGKVGVTATVNGNTSEPYPYYYIEPCVPILDWNTANCANPDIQAYAYNADGTIDTVNITITAPNNAFNGGNTATVASTGFVNYGGPGGVFTAVSQCTQNSECVLPDGGVGTCQTSTGSCTAGTNICTSSTNIPAAFQICIQGICGPMNGNPCWQAPPPLWGPDPFITINPQILSSTVQWVDPMRPYDYFEISGGSTVASQIGVTLLGIRDLQALVESNPYVFINTSNTGSFQFMGGALQVTDGTNTALPSSGTVSFQLASSPPSGASYHIVGLTSSGTTAVWQEAYETYNPPAGSIEASVQTPGTYALVMFTPK